jgi:hypothetical protein
MPIIVQCFYRPGGADERLRIRDVHLEYIIKHQLMISTGGALMSADRKTTIGMFLVLEYDEVELAEAFLAEEPYSQAGLFNTRTIEVLDRFIPHPDQEFLPKLLSLLRQRIDSDAHLQGSNKTEQRNCPVSRCSSMPVHEEFSSTMDLRD